MNIPMLKKVRAAILKRPRQFEMGEYFSTYLEIANDFVAPSHCGTAACIAGWAVHVQSGNKQLDKSSRDYGSGVWNVAKDILDINEDQAWRLFYASYWPEKYQDKYDTDDATPASRAKAAAARINHFIKTKGRE